MTVWSPELIETVAGADDLHVAPFRPDGVTPGTPTWIWSVVVDGRLFVRPYNGSGSRWYGAAMAQGAGQVSVAGATHDVVFSPAEPAVLDAVDSAYRAKYAASPYLAPMIGPRTRPTTVEIRPRQRSRAEVDGGTRTRHRFERRPRAGRGRGPDPRRSRGRG
jgi:hypothetical protein